MRQQRDFIVEGFRITRDDTGVTIEVTDYHATPLRLTQAHLAELGLRLVNRPGLFDLSENEKQESEL